MDGDRIVVVAAEAEGRTLADHLSAAGYAVGAHTALDDVSAAELHLARVLIAVRSALPDGDAGAFVREVVERDAYLPVVICAPAASVADAVDFMHAGAFSVLSEPTDADALRLSVQQALRHRELCLRNSELQRSLEVHERLAMIGKLAAGVAHELNNPLDGVLRFVNLSIDSLPKDGNEIPYLLEARRGLRRMADIVRDLLQFSRNAAVEASDEDGLRLAQDAVQQMVALSAHKRIETTFQFPPHGVQLPRGMFQVFGNLAKNAVDAISGSGQISVTARIVEDEVRIEFADSGGGIEDEIRDRIFEPFFTTKEVGQGTGLGLPICQRIVERLGGSLVLESEPGVGTCVVLMLPQGAAPGGVVKPALAQPFVHSGIRGGE